MDCPPVGQRGVGGTGHFMGARTLDGGAGRLGSSGGSPACGSLEGSSGRSGNVLEEVCGARRSCV